MSCPTFAIQLCLPDVQCACHASLAHKEYFCAIHDTTTPQQAHSHGASGWWLRPSLGCCQYARGIYICKSSMPSRCHLVLPRLFCIQGATLCHARHYCTAATVGTSTDEGWGLGCGAQTERKLHQRSEFRCALQMSTDLATSRLHTLSG